MKILITYSDLVFTYPLFPPSFMYPLSNQKQEEERKIQGKTTKRSSILTVLRTAQSLSFLVHLLGHLVD